MTSIASLESELKKLGSQSKRHSTALSQSSEASLAILESVVKQGLEENHAIHALREHDPFVTPFILACSEASAKSCASALQCIQTLATYDGIAPARLKELLEALMEATQLGLGIQLKILQVLPVILFEFSTDLSGSLLVDLLAVCTELLGSNKVAMVHNTAYATLQQLINGVFDRTDMPGDEEEPKQQMTIDYAGTTTFMVKPHLHDSGMVLVDLCDIAENQAPRFTRLSGLSLTFTLELLELTLSNQAPLIHKYDELASILRIRVVPLLLRLFSEAAEFPIVLRATRIFYLLLRQHLNILTTESEVILSTITQCAIQSPLWKRSLCLEVLQGLFLEVDLLVEIYTIFDKEARRTNIIKTIISDFANVLTDNKNLVLASELTQEQYNRFMNPSSQNNSNEESSQHGSTDSQPVFLSKNSALNVPVIEMLDRVEPPRVSIAYPYYQILKCINSFADDIHKMVATEGKAKQLLNDTANPLLRCYSVSLAVSMDVDLFRLVVRAVQRLAHASGIIAVKATRDEFMQLLAQYCYIPDRADGGSDDNDGEHVDVKQWVLPRCSLCVRALFNLGYALGNQLGGSWYLITNTISNLNKCIEHRDPVSLNCIFGNNAPDYSTLNLAMRKLMDSTVRLSDQALISFMSAIGAEKDTVKYEILKNIAVFNEARVSEPETNIWPTFADIMLKGIYTDPTSGAVDALTEVSEWIVTYTANNLDDDARVDKTLAMVIGSICKVIHSPNLVLKISSFQHLNSILEKFGQYISSGWQYVFEIVSSIPKTKNLELIRCAFITLELICSDFLENLPYSCVFSLTLCLDEFSKQDTDLNTSFTSVSLFWSVCDHLMAIDEKVNTNGLDFSGVKSENDLVDLARNHEAESSNMALWLLAVIKLASIAGVVRQHQVRTSTIQIFLRIFNTHGPKLSRASWDVAHRLAFPKLLVSARVCEQSDNSIPQDIEIYTLVIEGISRVDLLFLPSFYFLESFQGFWLKWVEFLDESARISPHISISVYRNLKVILDSKNAKYMSSFSLYDFWKRQDILPAYSEKYPKLTADSLRELVSMYPLVSAQSEKSIVLEHICKCALFPYYTTIMPGNSKGNSMSLLQQSCTETLDSIDVTDGWNVVSQYLLLLDELARSPYKTVETDNSDTNGSNFTGVVLKPNFSGISLWAQNKLLELIPDGEETIARQPPIDTISPTIITTANMVINNGDSVEIPMKIILKLLSLSTDTNAFHGSELVDTVKTVLKVSDDGSSTKSVRLDEITTFLKSLIASITGKSLNIENWYDILHSILQYSVLYERSIHNMHYYEVEDPDLTEALQFGTTDIPRPIHHKKISFFCLKLLCELGCDKNIYSERALKYFKTRARAVLYQYIGDCKVLGQEPIRDVLKSELSCVLEQLTAYSDRKEVVDNEMRDILLQAISGAHSEYHTALREILKVAVIQNLQ